MARVHHKDIEKVKLLALDLRGGKDYPRSPRELLAGYVFAARAVDKCRAVLVGWQGEYESNCPLDKKLFAFTKIKYKAFRDFVATGTTDDEIAVWIQLHAKRRSRQEIVVWNNKQRDTRLSDLPPAVQVILEDLIQKSVPRDRMVYRWFDIYDFVEKRM